LLLCCDLDLRWNNVGLLGGRELLKAFDYNKTLARLSLAGNNVPTDVLKAIGKLKRFFSSVVYRISRTNSECWFAFVLYCYILYCSAI